MPSVTNRMLCGTNTKDLMSVWCSTCVGNSYWRYVWFQHVS